MTNPVWYRYEDRTFAAPLDEFDRPIGESSVQVDLFEYQVVKETPCGVWLSAYGFCAPRWCKKGATRRFACPTKDEALESFLARKRRQLGILQARARKVEEAIRLAEGRDEFDEVAAA